MKPNRNDQISPKIYQINYLQHRAIKKFIIKNIKIHDLKGKKLHYLDIGCQNKPYSLLFGSSNCCYWGLDVDPNTAADVIGNGIHLPFKDASFDIVLCTQVMEHIFDFRSLVVEVYRCLQNKGILFLSVPFVWPLHAIPDDYCRFSRYMVEKMLIPLFNTVMIESSNGYLYTLCALINETTNLIPRRWYIKALLFPLYVVMNLVGVLTDKIFLNETVWKFFPIQLTRPTQSYRQFPLNFFVVAVKS